RLDRRSSDDLPREAVGVREAGRGVSAATQRQPAGAAALWRDAGVGGEVVPSVHRQVRTAAAVEADELRVALLGRPAELLDVELLRALDVGDAEGEHDLARRGGLVGVAVARD